MISIANLAQAIRQGGGSGPQIGEALTQLATTLARLEKRSTDMATALSSIKTTEPVPIAGSDDPIIADITSAIVEVSATETDLVFTISATCPADENFAGCEMFAESPLVEDEDPEFPTLPGAIESRGWAYGEPGGEISASFTVPLPPSDYVAALDGKKVTYIVYLPSRSWSYMNPLVRLSDFQAGTPSTHSPSIAVTFDPANFIVTSPGLKDVNIVDVAVSATTSGTVNLIVRYIPPHIGAGEAITIGDFKGVTAFTTTPGELNRSQGEFYYEGTFNAGDDTEYGVVELEIPMPAALPATVVVQLPAFSDREHHSPVKLNWTGAVPTGVPVGWGATVILNEDLNDHGLNNFNVDFGGYVSDANGVRKGKLTGTWDQIDGMTEYALWSYEGDEPPDSLDKWVPTDITAASSPVIFWIDPPKTATRFYFALSFGNADQTYTPTDLGPALPIDYVDVPAGTGLDGTHIDPGTLGPGLGKDPVTGKVWMNAGNEFRFAEDGTLEMNGVDLSKALVSTFNGQELRISPEGKLEIGGIDLTKTLATSLNTTEMNVVNGKLAITGVDLSKVLPTSLNTSELRINPGSKKLEIGGIDLSKVIESTLSEELRVSNEGKFEVAFVSAQKIAAGTLSAGVIYGGQIIAEQIVSGTISAGVVYAGTINAGQINAGTLNAGVIYSGTINAENIAAGHLAAGVIYGGTITASQIQAGTLAAGVIYAGNIAASQIMAGTLAVGVIYAGTINASQIVVDASDPLKKFTGVYSTGDIHTEGWLYCERVSCRGGVHGNGDVSGDYGIFIGAQIGQLTLSTAPLAVTEGGTGKRTIPDVLSYFNVYTKFEVNALISSVSGGSGAVLSVFGRTGAIAAQASDYIGFYSAASHTHDYYAYKIHTHSLSDLTYATENIKYIDWTGAQKQALCVMAGSAM